MAMDDKSGGPSPAATAQTIDAPVIIDLGKQKRKKVKALRVGTGELMDEIQAAISEIRRAGRISSTAQPVIIVVTEKPKSKRFGMGMFK